MICPYCKSKFIQKKGVRRNNQRYRCNKCKKQFQSPIYNDYIDIVEDVHSGNIYKLDCSETVRIYCATDIHHGAIEHDYKKFNFASW